MAVGLRSIAKHVQFELFFQFLSRKFNQYDLIEWEENLARD